MFACATKSLFRVLHALKYFSTFQTSDRSADRPKELSRLGRQIDWPIWKKKNGVRFDKMFQKSVIGIFLGANESTEFLCHYALNAR